MRLSMYLVPKVTVSWITPRVKLYGVSQQLSGMYIQIYSRVTVSVTHSHISVSITPMSHYAIFDTPVHKLLLTIVIHKHQTQNNGQVSIVLDKSHELYLYYVSN